ncbi:MAG: heat-inducible transcriptional repressor HrcA [Clostridia bacterium]|nr:heat-inducible transcriptional repressor HrcA [Clostridia bacterium]
MEKLSDRKEKILKAVVDEYIKSATPVSSGEIKDKHFNNISSATIRSELSTLEDMGYLIKPHTSAGRIPSKDAYKLYIDRFMVKIPLKQKEMELIQNSFKERFEGVEEIVRRTAKVISDITNYTSVIVLSNINKVKIKEIKLVELDEHSALVIIITDSGIIRDKVIALSNPMSTVYVKDANALINKMFSGKTVAEIKSPDAIIKKELADFKELYDSIIAILESYGGTNDSNVFIEGTSKFLDYPEYDLDSAKKFLTVLDTKEKFAELIEQNQDIEFSIRIGKDESCGLEKCAIVTARYKLNGKEIGHAGVIGPERMDYSKVVSVLSYVGKTLEKIADGGNDDKEKQ